jgi:hypothetical protein
MVYLNVYNEIFKYLEDIGIVEDVFEHAGEMISPIFGKIKSNEVMNDIVAEIAFFNYMHNGELLIDFLSENLYPKLDEEDKKDFDLVKESKRFNLKFNKKEKINELDTKGKELYYFHFDDIDNNESKVIVSSTMLDELGFNLNARLIKNPNHEGKFSIIGGIFEKEVAEAIPKLSRIKQMKENIGKTKEYISYIFDFSKNHTLEEIKKYKNEKTAFLEQDRKIMEINRKFFEKFNKGFDNFLKDFLELSNNHENFSKMAEYYVTIADELRETIMDTNYNLELELLDEKALIKGFTAFIKKDRGKIAKCIAELKEIAKKEFEIGLKNEEALSREKIIKHTKKFLKENVSKINPKEFNLFFNKIDDYSPDQISNFLSDIVSYMEKLPDDKAGIETALFTAMSKDLLERADNMPYLEEIKEQQKGHEYISEEFYEYIDADDNIYDLYVFLSATDHLANDNPKKAYELLKKNKIEKTNSFDMMFLIGKIFSFFDDKRYRGYFNEAKKVDKKNYKKEIQSFLEEKEQKRLNL